MMHSYSIYIAAKLNDTGKSPWAVTSYPNFAKWNVELGGKSATKDVRKLYLLGVLAALDDLTKRCEVQINVDSWEVLNTLVDIGSGLRPNIGNLALLENLLKQFDRHIVSVALDMESTRMNLTRKRL